MSKLFWTFIECVAAFMVFSAVMYAFTGLTWWVPMQLNEYGRLMDPERGALLLVCHIVPIFAAVAHRATL